MYEHKREAILTKEYFQRKEEEREKQHLLIASIHYKYVVFMGKLRVTTFLFETR